MLVLACVGLGVLIWWLLGGDLRSLAALPLRHGAIVFAGLGLQLLIFTPAATLVPDALVVPAHIASYVLVGAFLAINWRRAGLPVLGLGFSANALVIALNHGRMPISLEAWTATGRPASELTSSGGHNNNVLAGAHSHLAWLGDVFALPREVPFANSLSVGDLLIIAGALLLLSSGGRTASRPGKELLRPLADTGFRRLTAARVASQVGDWITIAATVSWVYHDTHSTAWLSAFMIARIAAFALGGAAGAHLLGYPSRRTLAALCGARGLLTTLALVSAAEGDVIVALVLLVASALLATPASATASSFVPNLVKEPQLHSANALMAFAGEIAMVLGTAAGSLIVARSGVTAALAVDAATFAVSAVVFGGLPVQRRAAAAEARGRRRRPFELVWDSPTVFWLLASFVVATVAMGLLNSSLPRFLASQVRDDHAYGYAMAAIGAGAMLGGLLAGTNDDNKVIRRLLPLSFGAMGLALLVISQSDVAATILLLLAFLGAADAATEVGYMTVLQRSVASDNLPGVLSLGSTGINIGMIAGFASAALLARIASPSATLEAAAATCLCGGLVALYVTFPARRRGREPAGKHGSAAPPPINLEALALDDLAALARRYGLPTIRASESELRRELARLL